MSGGPKGSKEERAFDVKDIVLGKIKGYPGWPAMIIDPDEVPANVTADRPTGKKYYCVRFFPAGDFAWLTARDVQPLPKSEIEKFIGAPKGVKRNGDLLAGYKIALDPAEWESTINDVIAKKLQHFVPGEDDEDVDMDDQEEAGKKKRRRSDGANGGAAKKKRRTTKGGAGKLSAETVESEDDGDAAVMSAAAATSAAATKKKEKEEDEKYAHLKNDKGAMEIKQVRHSLQKMFLSKTIPTNEQLEKADLYFKELEVREIPLEYLGYSKIGKVMRHIGSLPDENLPREKEFKFRDRAGDLVRKWHEIADKSNENGVTV